MNDANNPTPIDQMTPAQQRAAAIAALSPATPNMPPLQDVKTPTENGGSASSPHLPVTLQLTRE